MLRYFALATVIVVGTMLLATAWVNRDLIRMKIASIAATPEPNSAVALPTTVVAGGPPFRGDAPWALSAVPECMIQRSESRGRRAYVLAHLPRKMVAIQPPATLAYGDCTIFVTGVEAYVRRGADRFHIPERVRFYRAPGALALLRENGPSLVLRIYQTKPSP